MGKEDVMDAIPAWETYTPSPELDPDAVPGGWAIVTLKSGKKRAGWLKEVTFAGVGFASLAQPTPEGTLPRGDLLGGVTIADVHWCSEAEAQQLAARTNPILRAPRHREEGA
jgi:hypothetical protein